MANVSIRMTDAEKDSLQKQATTLNITLTELIKLKLFTTTIYSDMTKIADFANITNSSIKKVIYALARSCDGYVFATMLADSHDGHKCESRFDDFLYEISARGRVTSRTFKKDISINDFVTAFMDTDDKAVDDIIASITSSIGVYHGQD